MRAVLLVMGAALVLSALAELAFVDRGNLEDPFAGSTLPLFWSGFGLVWCVVIVLVSKWLGHAFLTRHRDPYTGEPVEDEHAEGGDG